jgi:hypothetical protein
MLRWKSANVSGLVRKYSRFVETNGGDYFDHDCRPIRPLSTAGKLPRMILPVTMAAQFMGRHPVIAAFAIRLKPWDQDIGRGGLK